MAYTKPLLNIPTNIITGFLGVGKTTAIGHLLAHKPAHERWAVLVNEFGEVGIDEGLMSGQHAEGSGVYIRQVPGGCMCCAAGLPMQIALNMLLAKARPDRLLIEPTGLGHPREVLGVLSGDTYRGVLDLRATVTLVDARKLGDSRYRDNTTYNQQLAIADMIVANKADLYQPGDQQALADYLAQNEALRHKPVRTVCHAALKVEWLQAPCAFVSARQLQVPQDLDAAPALQLEPQLPPCGYLSMDNQGEGYVSRGWVFAPQRVFNQQRLYAFLSGVEVERLKGVFICDDGVVGFNKSGQVLTSVYLDDAADSRVELITHNPQLLENIEQPLLDCLQSSS